MSNFTPTVTKKLTFEGEEITVRFSRLKRKHVLRHLGLFSEYSKKFGDEPELDEGEIDPQADEKMEILMPFLDDIGDRLPDYVKSVEGLKDAEGNDISISTISEDAYFLPLVTDLVLAMAEESLGSLGKK